MGYVGRLAPSPTGLLHLGHAATFAVAAERARAAAGMLLLRNEDLDPQRSRAEYVAAMVEDLGWLGIRWTPPVVTQSERMGAYFAACKRLLAMGLAYPCGCSRKDLARMTQAPHDDVDDEPVYANVCRPGEALAQSFRAETNYRFRISAPEPVLFQDGNLGWKSFMPGRDFGDFLVWRKDGLPSYQLACVVDDAFMGVTEVVRGEDLLKSTARQILLQRALGLGAVEYFHARLLRDGNGVRLAKRHDALAIRTLREQGLTAAEVLRLAAACGESIAESAKLSDT